MPELILLKLGGSLITDKTLPYTPHLAQLDQLCTQIRAAQLADPGLVLVLGHGSGSFGHTAARQHRTRDGLPAQPTAEQAHAYWQGFAEVWLQASTLNRHVMQALHKAGIPAISMPPVAAVTAHNGKVGAWDLSPLKAALTAGLLPVVFGDVIFDTTLGGTILSTEDLFEYLAHTLQPQRILLAGLEGAVWADFPQRTQRVEKITPASFAQIKTKVGASHGADVTGGMESKVRQMLELVQANPRLTVQIFSGESDGSLLDTLSGRNIGTLIAAE